MNEGPAALPLPPPPQAEPRDVDQAPPWFAAAAQVLLVSGVPTQLAVMILLSWGLGISPVDDRGDVTFQFFVLGSLLDTLLVGALIVLFLSQSAESVRDLVIGRRSAKQEAIRGIVLVPFAFLLALGTVLLLRTSAPWTHNVEVNPLERFMGSPLEALIFAAVAVIAGGLREELQRAFVLHRFEQRLGGIRLGLVLFTALFGLLHWNQGIDVAIGIGVLGLFWGLLFIKRRSAVCGMANHAGFNAIQVMQAMVLRSLNA